jgi:hypothetical protein
VNAGLLVINLFSAPGRLWVVSPPAGRGIGVAIHGAGACFGGRPRFAGMTLVRNRREICIDAIF